jgi:transcriptional regulator NrdR family protein
MAGRTLKRMVVKADGTTEEYIHTKVVGAIANALSAAGQPDIGVAEELAEVVTFFLYQQAGRQSVGAGEILSIIKAVLADTGFEAAAAALSLHHFQRKLRRSRVEVVRTPAEAENQFFTEQARSRWDKSRIVEDVVAQCALSRQGARAVASMVEEKVLNMDLPHIPAGLVKQLVINAAASVISAQQQLQKA